MIRFEWDEAKNEINRRKHKISFSLAVRVFEDPQYVLVKDRVEAGEERWHAIGEVNGTLIVTVVHTYQTDDLIRIIAARFANREERELYAEAYGR